MSHFQDVRQRWIRTRARSKKRFLVTHVEPTTDNSFRRRAQRLPPDAAGSDDLNIVSKHLRVIDHLLKHRFVQSEISRCQHCTEQGPHVFHEGMPSSTYSRPRNELGVHGSASTVHAVELTGSVCIARDGKAR